MRVKESGLIKLSTEEPVCNTTNLNCPIAKIIESAIIGNEIIVPIVEERVFSFFDTFQETLYLNWSASLIIFEKRS